MPTLRSGKAAEAADLSRMEDISDNGSENETARNRRENPPKNRRQAVLAIEEAKRLEQMSNSAAKWLRENRPEVKGLEAVKELLPLLPISDKWNQNDRELMEENWIADPQRRRKLDVDVKKNTQLLTTHKACLQLLHCLPLDIISPRFCLKYDNSQNTTSTLAWTAHFCSEFNPLLYHPMWMEDPGLLATAIQYVVIMQTDDRRPWVTTPPNLFDLYPRLLQEASVKESAGRSMRDIRRDLQFPGRGSYWSRLFDAVDKLIEPQTETEPPTHSDQTTYKDPYLVRREHLVILRNALESMSNNGCPVWYATKTIAITVGGRRATGSYPNAGDLVALMDYANHRAIELQRFVEVHGVGGGQTWDGAIPLSQAPAATLPASPALPALREATAGSSLKRSQAFVLGSQLEQPGQQQRPGPSRSTGDRPTKRGRFETVEDSQSRTQKSSVDVEMSGNGCPDVENTEDFEAGSFFGNTGSDDIDDETADHYRNFGHPGLGEGDEARRSASMILGDDDARPEAPKHFEAAEGDAEAGYETDFSSFSDNIEVSLATTTRQHSSSPDGPNPANSISGSPSAQHDISDEEEDVLPGGWTRIKSTESRAVWLCWQQHRDQYPEADFATE